MLKTNNNNKEEEEEEERTKKRKFLPAVACVSTSTVLRSFTPTNESIFKILTIWTTTATLVHAFQCTLSHQVTVLWPKN